jgi:hypothetical protein
VAKGAASEQEAAKAKKAAAKPELRGKCFKIEAKLNKTARIGTLLSLFLKK